jgi:hypothetical protein
MAAKEKHFAESKNALYDTVPKLLREYAKHGDWPMAETISDVTAYATALDALLVNAEGTILSCEDPARTVAAADVRERHERRRILQKVSKKVLCRESKELRAFLKVRPYDRYTEFRVLDADCDVVLEPLVLAGSRALFAHPNTHEPRVIHIEDAQFIKMQRSLFMYLWESATPATLGHIHV